MKLSPQIDHGHKKHQKLPIWQPGTKHPSPLSQHSWPRSPGNQSRQQPHTNKQANTNKANLNAAADGNIVHYKAKTFSLAQSVLREIN